MRIITHYIRYYKIFKFKSLE